MKNISMNKISDRKTKLVMMVLACLSSYLFFPATAFAYVDPGSGSVIVTTILGLIAAIGYTLRKYFYKLKRMTSGKKMEEEQQDSD